MGKDLVKTPARRPIVLGRATYNNRRENVTFKVSNSALCDLFTKLDRTLGGKRHRAVRVESSQMDFAPSWTDGTTVSIMEKALDEAVKNRGADLLAVFGLNYHELAHVLFTPKLDQNSRVWLEGIANGAIAFNMLEDIRIEHLIRQLYPRMTVYLLAIMYKYFFDVPRHEFANNWSAYAVLSERRYVPREDRQLVRDVMVNKIGEDKTQEVEAICAEYVRLADLGTREFLPKRPRELIEKLAALITEASGQTGRQVVQVCIDNSHRHTDRSNAKKRNPGAGAMVYREIDGDDYEPLEQGGTPKGSLPGQRENKNSGKDKGKGFDRHGSASITFIEEEIAGSVEVQNDLKLADQVIDRAQFNLDQAPESHWKMRPVTAAMRKSRDDFVRQLTQIQDQVDPGWDPDQVSGRLNIGRAMEIARHEYPGDLMHRAFDDWREDRSDALDIEAKLLLDMSGSMAGPEIGEMSKAFWAIGSALDTIAAKVDQIGYSDSTFQLRPREERENLTNYRHYGTLGGTNPRIGIAKSRYDFENSSAKHKLFIILSDGGWQDAEDDRDIEDMQRVGVHTVMVWVGDLDPKKLTAQQRQYYSHGCEHFINVTRGEQLADFTRTLVTSLMRGSAVALGR